MGLGLAWALVSLVLASLPLASRFSGSSLALVYLASRLLGAASGLPRARLCLSGAASRLGCLASVSASGGETVGELVGGEKTAM